MCNWSIKVSLSSSVLKDGQTLTIQVACFSIARRDMCKVSFVPDPLRCCRIIRGTTARGKGPVRGFVKYCKYQNKRYAQ